jgi:hypothetical protein
MALQMSEQGSHPPAAAAAAAATAADPDHLPPREVRSPPLPASQFSALSMIYRVRCVASPPPIARSSRLPPLLPAAMAAPRGAR